MCANMPCNFAFEKIYNKHKAHSFILICSKLFKVFFFQLSIEKLRKILVLCRFFGKALTIYGIFLCNIKRMH